MVLVEVGTWLKIKPLVTAFSPQMLLFKWDKEISVLSDVYWIKDSDLYLHVCHARTNIILTPLFFQ